MARQVPCFQLLSENEMEELIAGMDSKSTKNSLKFALNKLESFAGFIQKDLTEVSRSPGELDSFLSQFYPALKKEDGTAYSKKSIQSIRYGIQRHFLDKYEYDICDKSRFPMSNKMFKAILVKLKKEGKGSVKHKSVITDSDMDKIQASMDLSTPLGLQNKVFIDLMLFFCNRGRENIRQFKPSYFTLEVNEDGLRYVVKRDLLTKNNREDEDESSNSGRMFEVPNSDRCPVSTYLFYVSKLSPQCEFLWQQPKKEIPGDGKPWYYASPLGVNTIANKVKEISAKAGCSKIYTNHCLRATCITALDSAGFESRDIMTVSGHHSVQSLKHYSKTSDERKKQMSVRLAEQLYRSGSSNVRPNVPSSSTVSQINESITPVTITESETERHPLQVLQQTASSIVSSVSESSITVRPGPGSDAPGLGPANNSPGSTSTLLHQHQEISNSQSIHGNTFHFHGCQVHIYNK